MTGSTDKNHNITFGALPTEVFRELVHYLPSEDLKTLSQTSKTLQTVFRPQSWKYCLAYSEISIGSSPAGYPQFRALKIDTLLNPHKYSWFDSSAVKHITAVDVLNSFQETDALELQLDKSYFPKLKNFEIRDAFRKDVADELLKSPLYQSICDFGAARLNLQLEFDRTTTQSLFYQTPGILANITHLRLMYIDIGGSQLPDHLDLRSLKAITLMNLTCSARAYFLQQAAACKQLQYVGVGIGAKFNPTEGNVMFEWCVENLQQLPPDLRQCEIALVHWTEDRAEADYSTGATKASPLHLPLVTAISMNCFYNTMDSVFDYMAVPRVQAYQYNSPFTLDSLFSIPFPRQLEALSQLHISLSWTFAPDFFAAFRRLTHLRTCQVDVANAVYGVSVLPVLLKGVSIPQAKSSDDIDALPEQFETLDIESLEKSPQTLQAILQNPLAVYTKMYPHLEDVAYKGLLTVAFFEALFDAVAESPSLEYFRFHSKVKMHSSPALQRLLLGNPHYNPTNKLATPLRQVLVVFKSYGLELTESSDGATMYSRKFGVLPNTPYMVRHYETYMGEIEKAMFLYSMQQRKTEKYQLSEITIDDSDLGEW